MKWRRLFAFLLIVLSLLAITFASTGQLYKHTKLGLDLQGGYDLVYQIDSGGRPLSTHDEQAVLAAVQLRVNSAGIGSPIIELEDHDRINVELAGTHSAAQANAIIGQTAQLRIYPGAGVREPNGHVMPFSPSNALLPHVTVFPKGPVLVTGNDLKSNASWQQDPVEGNVVVVSFKHPTKWAKITSKYLGKTIYTFLGSKLVNQATITQIIPGGNTQITGMTQQECVLLAKELNAGALPYPLHLISSTTIGPSLGKASLQGTMRAGIFAIGLIMAFMVMVYRVAGLVANLGLVAYVYMIFALFSGLGIVLTLPGLAALVLGMGMAVDANIITYERIKDEVKNGRSLLSGVIAGHRRALRTILDSNATTFIAGAVMYFMGQGDIRGFAIALMLSILTSLLTAVFLSRTMLLQLARANILKRPRWFGFGKGGGRN